MAIVYLLTGLATLFSARRAWRRLRFFIHIFQLEGYKPGEYSTWLRRRGTGLRTSRSHRIGLGIVATGVLVANVYPHLAWLVILLIAWIITFASSRSYRDDRQKKPLKYTPRLVRLVAASLGVAILPVLLLVAAASGISPPDMAVFVYLGGWLIADWGAPVWIRLGAYLTGPVELQIQRGFKRQARAILQSRSNLTVIGITGSYGKTSVKFIIAELLRSRFNVLETPGSYNTPMGICLVVNNQLRPEHQVLILEMGARYPGDIRELCELAPPDISVVTSVGIAHLETMDSIEKIAETKSEIVGFARPGAATVLNADDENVLHMAGEATGPVYRVGLHSTETDLRAHRITFGPLGTSFEIEDHSGFRQIVQTRLLGRHNVLNILLAVAVGQHMGLRLRQMAHCIGGLKPVEHRLSLRKEGDVTIIDDAFNSNPVGARNAVEILGQFNTGRRIIVTPGMVELGKMQESENKSFGTFIADHIDFAVLIGPDQSRPVHDGLKLAAFPEEQTRIFPNLFEAQEFLKEYLKAGDVVLYENDLPDQYNES